ncbi:membrane protein DedA, SNARE-associated domain [Actinoplanes philippinensis]|uniref:Membrane protein DedA, SNARE-associated domain n=1 Tax=Actinoplanes philippinensis TaxID=35752 RepID=A0A1I2KH46_9ACTN|nr:membrane protein DedA, SNARE-associated domain [Actinoplanes philippinensis]
MDIVGTAEILIGSPYLYLLVFGVTMFDAVLPILPSEVLMVAVGVFATTGRPSWAGVLVSATTGMVAGDHVAYRTGRWLVHRRPAARVATAAARMAGPPQRRGGSLIVLGRFLPGGRVAINAACGAAGFPMTRFLLFAAAGDALWAGYALTLGAAGGVAFGADPRAGVAVGLGFALLFTGAARLWPVLRRCRRIRGRWSRAVRACGRRCDGAAGFGDGGHGRCAPFAGAATTSPDSGTVVMGGARRGPLARVGARSAVPDGRILGEAPGRRPGRDGAACRG